MLSCSFLDCSVGVGAFVRTESDLFFFFSFSIVDSPY